MVITLFSCSIAFLVPVTMGCSTVATISPLFTASAASWLPSKPSTLTWSSFLASFSALIAPSAISSLPAMTPSTSGFFDSSDSIFSWPVWRSQFAISLPTDFRSGYCWMTCL